MCMGLRGCVGDLVSDGRIPGSADPISPGSDWIRRIPKIRGSDLRSVFFRIRIPDPDHKKNISDLGSTDPDLNLNFLGSGSRIRIFYFFLISDHGSHSDHRSRRFFSGSWIPSDHGIR